MPADMLHAVPGKMDGDVDDSPDGRLIDDNLDTSMILYLSYRVGKVWWDDVAKASRGVYVHGLAARFDMMTTVLLQLTEDHWDKGKLSSWPGSISLDGDVVSFRAVGHIGDPSLIVGVCLPTNNTWLPGYPETNCTDGLDDNCDGMVSRWGIYKALQLLQLVNGILDASMVDLLGVY